MPKLSPAQRIVFDYMKKTGDHIMVWPPDGFDSGHFQFGESWGHYSVWMETPKTTIATIRSMKAKDCFVEVDRTNANATSTGKNAAVRYRFNPDFKID